MVHLHLHVFIGLAFLWGASGVHGAILPGGGSKVTDCLAVFDVPAAPTSKGRKVICTDGDPRCDADGLVNGACSFDLGVCINDTSEPRCLAGGVETLVVEHSEDNGDPDFDPDFQALQARIDSAFLLPDATPACTALSTLVVPLRGPYPGGKCKPGKKKVAMTADSEFDPAVGKAWSDRDKIKFLCKPAPDGCNPRDLFSGTFDRIQRQILNPTCAVSACHDSESRASDLLLETGASASALIGQTPVNFAAAMAGWQRVAPGDRANSFLIHKLEGRLASEYGERMPLDRKRVPSFLQYIVGAWVDAGAPTNDTWVPGTDN